MKTLLFAKQSRYRRRFDCPCDSGEDERERTCVRSMCRSSSSLVWRIVKIHISVRAGDVLAFVPSRCVHDGEEGEQPGDTRGSRALCKQGTVYLRATWPRACARAHGTRRHSKRQYLNIVKSRDTCQRQTHVAPTCIPVVGRSRARDVLLITSLLALYEISARNETVEQISCEEVFLADLCFTASNTCEDIKQKSGRGTDRQTDRSAV